MLELNVICTSWPYRTLFFSSGKVEFTPLALALPVQATPRSKLACQWRCTLLRSSQLEPVEESQRLIRVGEGQVWNMLVFWWSHERKQARDESVAGQ